jgi:hypothetical protein
LATRIFSCVSSPNNPWTFVIASLAILSDAAASNVSHSSVAISRLFGHRLRPHSFFIFVSGTRTTMSANTLRAQANRFLQLALEAHDKGQLTDAHQFTVKAAELLEGAVSLEELRKAASRAPTSSLPSRNSCSIMSGAKLDKGG